MNTLIERKKDGPPKMRHGRVDRRLLLSSRIANDGQVSYMIHRVENKYSIIY